MNKLRVRWMDQFRTFRFHHKSGVMPIFPDYARQGVDRLAIRAEIRAVVGANNWLYHDQFLRMSLHIGL